MAPISFRAGVAKRCLAIEHELIHNMRIWQSYNPPLSDQQTEIALERHYVSNWLARLDFAPI
jgi:hypothetical protein